MRITIRIEMDKETFEVVSTGPDEHVQHRADGKPVVVYRGDLRSLWAKVSRDAQNWISTGTRDGGACATCENGPST